MHELNRVLKDEGFLGDAPLPACGIADRLMVLISLNIGEFI
jgi:hypothetical protein